MNKPCKRTSVITRKTLLSSKIFLTTKETIWIHQRLPVVQTILYSPTIILNEMTHLKSSRTVLRISKKINTNRLKKTHHIKNPSSEEFNASNRPTKARGKFLPKLTFNDTDIPKIKLTKPLS